MSQNVPGSPVIKNMQQAQGNIATYIVRGSPLERKQHAAGISMEKNEKISVSIDCYTKSKKEVSGEFFSVYSCRTCLPATAPYHGRPMFATRLTSSSHNSVSKAF